MLSGTSVLTRLEGLSSIELVFWFIMEERDGQLSLVPFRLVVYSAFERMASFYAAPRK